MAMNKRIENQEHYFVGLFISYYKLPNVI